MPTFEGPRRFRSYRNLRAWNKAVEPELQHPDLLWKKYWDEFNTIKIHILDEYEYFDTALAIAKLANGRKDEFERILKEMKEKKLEEMFELMDEANFQTIYERNIFPCKDALNTVAGVSMYGSFRYFIRLLKGNAFGWEADVIEETIDPPPTPIKKVIRRPDDEDGYPYVPPASYEGPHPLDCPSPDPETYQPEPDDEFNRDYIPVCTSPIGQDPSLNAGMVYLGTVSYIPATDISPETENHSERAQTTHGKRKRVHFHDDITNAQRHDEDPESITTTPSLISHTSSQQTTDGSATNEESIPENDSHSYKRRRIESPSTLEPTLITPSLQLAEDKSTSRKRSRRDDDDDDDDDDHGHKRQRSKPPASHTLTPAAVQRQTSDRQCAIQEPLLDSHGRNHRNKLRQKKRKPPQLSKTLHSPKHANTRTTRRAGEPTFWELDQLGKPRPI
ncbi:hypothetical protein V8C34DRAFT_284117 [Trichoderma compactum]